MKKKVNFFCWKIGPVSETVYPAIKNGSMIQKKVNELEQ